MNRTTLPFVVKLPLVILSIFGLGYLAKLGQSLLAPFFFAFLVAMLFLPFVDFVERKFHFPRALSSVVAVLLLMLILSGLGFFFGTQFSSFSNDVPLFLKKSNDLTFQLQSWLTNSFGLNINEQLAYADEALKKILSSSGVILGFTFGVFSSSLGFLVFFLLFFVFILNYRKILNTFITNVFSEQHKASVSNIITEIQVMTKSYILGISLQALIVAIITSVFLSVIGVKYALLLGILTGLLNVIPYLGIGISLLVSSFIAFATGTNCDALYVIFGYVIIHVIDGNVILPFVVGSKVKINALFSFIGIIIGEQFWGISGMFLCIPAMAIIKIIFERIDDLKAWGSLLGEDTSSS